MNALSVGAGMADTFKSRGWPLWRNTFLAGVALTVVGCANQDRDARARRPGPPRVLVVAPVLNLSGSQDFDPLKVTDLLASEFLSFEGIVVVPVNLALAELERRGKYSVETPEDARALAVALGADATIVTAITEYSPYPPPVVGMIMQWYSAGTEAAHSTIDPVSASRAVSSPEYGLSEASPLGPRWQVQRVFNAAHEEVSKEIRSFASERDDDESPYGWRRYIKSQELYVRYCGWAMIRTMLTLDESDRVAVEPNEASS